MKKVDYTLYFITNLDFYYEVTFLNIVIGACLGWATIIQLREKNKSTLEYYELAVKVKNITDAYNIPLIIDDRMDVAMAVGCGVHFGYEDMPISVARKIMGENCIIGATAKTVEVAKKAEADGADYLGCGAIYPTKTHVKTKITSVQTLNDICSAAFSIVRSRSSRLIGLVVKSNAPWFMALRILSISP